MCVRGGSEMLDGVILGRGGGGFGRRPGEVRHVSGGDHSGQRACQPEGPEVGVP